MSEHSNTHHGTIGLKDAILNAGENAWRSQLLPVGDKHEPFMVLVLDADNEQMSRYYRDISGVFGARAGGTFLTHDGKQCQLVVPTFVFDELIKPMLLGQEGILHLKSGPKIYNSDEAMLRAALHEIFFAPSLAQWQDHQIMGEKRCLVNLHELADRGLHVDLDYLEETARDEMKASYGIGTLRCEMSPWMGEATFTLPPHDFAVLASAMANERRALTQGEDTRPSNVTTMIGWRERQAEKAAGKQPD